jgi:LysR family transcriptional regulator, transcriptional activator of nhaA
VRVGAVATLSRNFQWEFLKPLRARRDVEVVLRSGNLRELMLQLRNHAVDVVLSNAPHARDAESTHRSHLLSEQAVSIVGRPGLAQKPLRFPEDLRDARMVLPSLESDIRAALDLLLDQAGLRPEVVAEVEDMAMLRILTVRLGVLAVAPRVVVQDELRRGELVEYRRLEMIQERFYAITQARQFPNAVVEDLIGRFGGKEGSASRSARR